MEQIRNEKMFGVNLYNASLFILIVSIFVTTNSSIRVVAEGQFFISSLLQYFKGLKIIEKTYIKWATAFLIYCTLSFFYSDQTSTVLYGIRGVLEVFLLGICLLLFLSKNQSIELVIKYFKYASIVLLFFTLATVSIDNIVFGRMSGSAMNANEIAVKWAFSLILLFYSKKENNNIITFTDYIYFFIFFAMIIFTGSKKGLLILILGLSLVYLVYAPKHGKLFSLIVVVLVVSLSLYFAFNNPTLYEIIGHRVEALFDSNADVDSSTRIRKAMIDKGMLMFQSKKWFGYGINTFQVYSGFGTYAHNNYVELLFDTGIIGTVIYYSIHLRTIINLLMLTGKNPEKRVVFFSLAFGIIALCDYGMVSYGNEFMSFVLSLFFFGTVHHKSEDNFVRM